jgi:hypothetical protein
MPQQDLFADDAAAEAAFQLPPEPFPTGPAFLPDQSVSPPAPEKEPAPEPAPPVEEDVPEFDARHREPFKGLLYLGALIDTFELYGHTFKIGTPTQTERLQIGQVIQPWQGTVTGEIAYQTALVAAYLIEIDGVKLPEPVLNNPKETALHDRFRWVSDNVRRVLIDKLFDECLKLDAQVDDSLAAMGKASG